MSAKTNSESKVNTLSEWHVNLNDTFQLIMWTSWKWFSVELQDSPTPVYAMVSDLGWEPLQTHRLHGRLNMFFSVSLEARWTPSGVPSSSTSPAGSSRSFPAIPASSVVCRCLQIGLRLLSKNLPCLECSPSGASRGRVIGGVQAASAVTPVTSPRHVYILHQLFFSALVPVRVHLCTASALHVLPSRFAVTISYVWRDILATY